MAGRYVILQFEDRDAANSFAMNETMAEQLGFKVIGLYLKSKVFCTCSDKSRQNNKNWKKNSKYGLFVCLRCGKPSVFHEIGVLQRLQYVFGYNLIEVESEEN